MWKEIVTTKNDDRMSSPFYEFLMTHSDLIRLIWPLFMQSSIPSSELVHLLNKTLGNFRRRLGNVKARLVLWSHIICHNY